MSGQGDGLARGFSTQISGASQDVGALVTAVEHLVHVTIASVVAMKAKFGNTADQTEAREWQRVNAAAGGTGETFLDVGRTTIESLRQAASNTVIGGYNEGRANGRYLGGPTAPPAGPAPGSTATTPGGGLGGVGRGSGGPATAGIGGAAGAALGGAAGSAAGPAGAVVGSAVGRAAMGGGGGGGGK